MGVGVSVAVAVAVAVAVLVAVNVGVAVAGEKIAAKPDVAPLQAESRTREI